MWKIARQGEIGAEFISIQRDNKKTVLKFHIKRDVDGKVNKLYPHAGANVSITLQPSQMSIEEFYEEPHDGVVYTINKDGSASVSPDQMLSYGLESHGSSICFFPRFFISKVKMNSRKSK